MQTEDLVFNQIEGLLKSHLGRSMTPP
jgi:hypothetical protein